MRKFDFRKIDAFATEKSAGNPAGCIILDSKDSISECEMQRIARELKGFVNEVGYIFCINDVTYDLRYYSSEREVDFCGHATIAIMYDLIKNTESLLHKPEIKISTKKGHLIVENLISDKDAVFIMSPAPEYRNCVINRNEIASALKLGTDDLDDRFPVEIINGGLETLIVPIGALQTILNISPDLETLKQFCIRNQIDIIEVFCDKVSNKLNQFRTRVFAPTFGYLEDPATGSGNSAFGYYLLKNGLWEGAPLSIEQNGYINDYNIIRLKVGTDSCGKRRVLFGGGAVTRIEGKYILV